MLLDEHLVELLLAVLALHSHHLLLLQLSINVHFLLSLSLPLVLLLLLILLLLLHRLYSRPEVLRSCLPILPCFGCPETFTFSHTHFLLILYLGLLRNRHLDISSSTCSLVTLLASELNSFLFDINTSLQAFACFSSAFLLNDRPHPSGHITKSFSLSGGSDSSASYSRIGRSSSGRISCFDACFSILGGRGGYSLLGGGGGSSWRFGSSLGCSLAMSIRFWRGILGGSLMGFFSSKSG